MSSKKINVTNRNNQNNNNGKLWSQFSKIFKEELEDSEKNDDNWKGNVTYPEHSSSNRSQRKGTTRRSDRPWLRHQVIKWTTPILYNNK